MGNYSDARDAMGAVDVGEVFVFAVLEEEELADSSFELVVRTDGGWSNNAVGVLSAGERSGCGERGHGGKLNEGSD